MNRKPIKRRTPLKRGPFKAKRTPLRRTPLRKKVKPKEQIEQERSERALMHLVFCAVWDARQDADGNCRCYQSDQILERWKYRGNTCCYHHVLPKKKGIGGYPQYKLYGINIVILHPDIHTRVENDLDKAPRVKQYKELLLHYEELYHGLQVFSDQWTLLEK